MTDGFAIAKLKIDLHIPDSGDPVAVQFTVPALLHRVSPASPGNTSGIDLPVARSIRATSGDPSSCSCGCRVAVAVMPKPDENGLPW